MLGGRIISTQYKKTIVLRRVTLGKFPYQYNIQTAQKKKLDVLEGPG
jgi:hypothetical protein